MSVTEDINTIRRSIVCNKDIADELAKLTAILEESSDTEAFSGTVSSTNGWEAGETGRLLMDARGALSDTLTRCISDLTLWTSQFEDLRKQAVITFHEQKSAQTAMEWFLKIRLVLPQSSQDALDGVCAEHENLPPPTSIRFVHENLWKPLLQTSGSSLPLKKLELVLLDAGARYSDFDTYSPKVSESITGYVEQLRRFGRVCNSRQFVGIPSFTELLVKPEYIQHPKRLTRVILGAGNEDAPRLDDYCVTRISKAVDELIADDGFISQLHELFERLEPLKTLTKAVGRAVSISNDLNIFRLGRESEDKFLNSRARYAWIGALKDEKVKALVASDSDIGKIAERLLDYSHKLDKWENREIRQLLAITCAVFVTTIITACAYNIAKLIEPNNYNFIWCAFGFGCVCGVTVSLLIWYKYQNLVRTTLYKRFDELEGQLSRDFFGLKSRCDNLQRDVDSTATESNDLIKAELNEIVTKLTDEWSNEHWNHFHELLSNYTQNLDYQNGWTRTFQEAGNSIVDEVRRVIALLVEHRDRLQRDGESPDAVLPQHRITIGTFVESEQPAVVYLHKSAPLLIASEATCDRTHSALINALEPIILDWFRNSPPGTAELILVDPVGMGIWFRDMIPLTKVDLGLSDKSVVYEESKTRDLIIRLEDFISRRAHRIITEDLPSINDYNKMLMSEGTPMERQVLLIVNHCEALLKDGGLSLARILSAGPICGVQTILLTGNGEKIFSDVDSKQLVDLTVPIHFVAKDQGVFKLGRDIKNFSVSGFDVKSPPLVRWNDFDEGRSDVERQLKNRSTSLQTLWDKWQLSCGLTSTPGLEIPVGFAGNQLLTFDFGKHRVESVHFLIVGGTGSGKSVLLHALIMSAIELYSYDEIELYLFDFKPYGNEFKDYGEYRPHQVRYVVLGAPPAVAVSVLDNLLHEMKNRAKKFDEFGVKNIDEFNVKFTEKRLPRTIIVMDEFQTLMTHDSANSILSEIARKGRSFGFHLVLASQSLSNVQFDAQIRDQIMTRIALRCNTNALGDVFSFGQSEGNHLRSLSRGKGAILITDDYGEGESSVFGQVAFAQTSDSLSRRNWTPGSTKLIDWTVATSSTSLPEPVSDVIPWGVPILTSSSPYTSRYRQARLHAMFCTSDNLMMERFARSIVKHRDVEGRGDNVHFLYSTTSSDEYLSFERISTHVGSPLWLTWSEFPELPSWNRDYDDPPFLSDFFEVTKLKEGSLVVVVGADTGRFFDWFASLDTSQRTHMRNSVSDRNVTLLFLISDRRNTSKFVDICMTAGLDSYAANDIDFNFPPSTRKVGLTQSDNMFIRCDLVDDFSEIIMLADWT